MSEIKWLDELFHTYRPAPTYPTYPPYHTGLYLEDYFYQHYKDHTHDLKRRYLPIFWTTCYIENKTHGLQNLINSLPAEEKYFTVSQHDDAIKETINIDLINFGAGGNKRTLKTYAIPLVCSEIPKRYIRTNPKDILASFVGSNTHPIRNTISNMFRGDDRIAVISNQWSPSVDEDSLNRFCEISSRSRFMLCPRGYGLNSFRLYESFQLGCVPVILTDEPYLPWADELDWSKFSITILDSQFDQLIDILTEISESTYREMIHEGQKAYQSHFTLDAVCHNIIKRLR